MRLLILCVALLLSLGLKAQKRNVEKQTQLRAEKLTEKMSENLALSKEQKAQVYQINYDMVSTKLSIKEKGNDKKEAMKVARKQRAEALKAVLTEDQIKKSKALSEERVQERKLKKEAKKN